MGMISASSKGDWSMSRKFLEVAAAKTLGGTFLNDYAEKGLAALQSATPKDTGKTADSWYYTIDATLSGVTIWWCNSNTHDGFHVAVGIQYGHGTGWGAWVEGIDYINPAIQPLFEEIANMLWKELTSL